MLNSPTQWSSGVLPILFHPLAFFDVLAAGGGPERRQEAATGRDAEEGGCRKPHPDTEGGAGLPEEHLL